MNPGRIDLNLLTVFEAVYRERHVGRAARSLNLSQPAVSGALARLRDVVGDPLFTRTGRGMLPTPRAREFAKPVQSALLDLRRALGDRGEFDPATSDRNFNLLLSEIGQITFLPGIWSAARRHAANVKIKVAQSGPSDRASDFEDGRIDLAIGFWPDLTQGLISKQLTQDHWVCMARADDGRLHDHLSLEEYLKLEHVSVMSGAGGDSIVSRILGRDKHARRIALEVTDFLAIPRIVLQTGLVATMPALLASNFNDSGDFKLVKVPIRLPEIELRTYWHTKNDMDLGRIWLTELVSGLFGNPQ